jgi:hypothetical protein
LSNPSQLNLFDQPSPVLSDIAVKPATLDNQDAGLFKVGDRIQIIKAGAPLQHLNGQKGHIVSCVAGNVGVQVEGVAVVLMFPCEALESWTPISEYTRAREAAETVELFRVGDRVECHLAFIGHVGTVQRIGMHCTITVAWVEYGEGKPLYPCALEYLSRVMS